LLIDLGLRLVLAGTHQNVHFAACNAIAELWQFFIELGLYTKSYRHCKVAIGHCWHPCYLNIGYTIDVGHCD
jgi:hypothetical protein